MGEYIKDYEIMGEYIKDSIQNYSKNAFLHQFPLVCIILTWQEGRNLMILISILSSNISKIYFIIIFKLQFCFK